MAKRRRGDLFFALNSEFSGLCMEHGVQYCLPKNLFLLINLRSTKLVRGWCTGERLMELGLSSPEKQRLGGNL